MMRLMDPGSMYAWAIPGVSRVNKADHFKVRMLMVACLVFLFVEVVGITFFQMTVVLQFGKSIFSSG